MKNKVRKHLIGHLKHLSSLCIQGRSLARQCHCTLCFQLNTFSGVCFRIQYWPTEWFITLKLQLYSTYQMYGDVWHFWQGHSTLALPLKRRSAGKDISAIQREHCKGTLYFSSLQARSYAGPIMTWLSLHTVAVRLPVYASFKAGRRARTYRIDQRKW